MKKNWLTINMYINAWLDCSNPFISVHNKFDDDVLAHFNAEKVNQFIDDGELAVEDLMSADPIVQMGVITDLITLQSGEKIKKQIKDMGSLVKKRKPKLQKVTLHSLDKPFKEPKRIQVSDLFSVPVLKVI